MRKTVILLVTSAVLICGATTAMARGVGGGGGHIGGGLGGAHLGGLGGRVGGPVHIGGLGNMGAGHIGGLGGHDDHIGIDHIERKTHPIAGGLTEGPIANEDHRGVANNVSRDRFHRGHRFGHRGVLANDNDSYCVPYVMSRVWSMQKNWNCG